MARSMDDIRRNSAAILEKAGFRFAPSLPVRAAGEAKVRPVPEIAGRFAALDVLCLYVGAPQDRFPTQKLLDLAESAKLREHLTESEAEMLGTPRDRAVEEHGNGIGWRMENMVSLAWVLGHEAAPSIDGAMIGGPPLIHLLSKIVPLDPASYAAWLASQRARPEDEVIQMEDVFYCAHNGVRGAQFPGKPSFLDRFRKPDRTVPEGFDPVANGGVIHERRHALTWCVSPGVAWEDTDLST